MENIRIASSVRTKNETLKEFHINCLTDKKLSLYFYNRNVLTLPGSIYTFIIPKISSNNQWLKFKNKLFWTK